MSAAEEAIGGFALEFYEDVLEYDKTTCGEKSVEARRAMTATSEPQVASELFQRTR